MAKYGAVYWFWHKGIKGMKSFGKSLPARLRKLPEASGFTHGEEQVLEKL